MMDLFLGVDQSAATEEHPFNQWIPDPVNELWKFESAQKASGFTEQDDRDVVNKKSQMKREMLIQDYWKQHAPDTDWKCCNGTQDNVHKFEAVFRQQAYGFNDRGHARNLQFALAFVVVTDDKIGIRSKAQLTAEMVTGAEEAPQAAADNTLHPGSCVIATATVELQGTTFLKLQGGGWVFQNYGGLEVMKRMSDTVVGMRWYQVVCKELVETRRAPTFDDSARTGALLAPKEVTVVCCKCTVDGETWLRLADGRGWVFECFSTSSGLKRVMVECEEAGVAGANTNGQGRATRKKKTPTSSAIERGSWIYEVLDREVVLIGNTPTGQVLAPRTTILVDIRVPANGCKTNEVSNKASEAAENRIWFRLEDGQGWIPKTGADNKPLVKFVGMWDKILAPSLSVKNAETEGRTWKRGVV